MKALVYLGPQEIAVLDKPLPQLEKESDVLVKIQATTICGTDLHVVHGLVPTAAKGRSLGHEGVGIIEKLGKAVSNFKVGDRVLISCNSSCGKCTNCKRGLTGQCADGGWVLGNTSDGCQAEYVRIPHADNSLHLLEDDFDPVSSVMLSDVLPTAYELGIKAGGLAPGQSIAVVGVGPVGLAAVLTAQFYSPAQIIAVDINEHRLSTARALGATDVVNNIHGDAIEQIMKITGGRGVDQAVESIGLPVGFEICEAIVAGGGTIAMLGVHGKPVTLHLEEMWKRNFSFTAGLVHTTTIPELMQAVRRKRLMPEKLISHHLGLSEVLKGYDIFKNASKHNSLKVILNNDLT
jgi:alcohol dehydrogenase